MRKEESKNKRIRRAKRELVIKRDKEGHIVVKEKGKKKKSKMQ